MKSYEIRWSNLESSGYLGSLSGDQKAKKPKSLQQSQPPEVEKCYWILVSIEDSRLLQPQKEGNLFWNKPRLDCWISSNMSKGRHEAFNKIWESFIACGVATCGSTQFYRYGCPWPEKQFTSCHAMWLLRCKECPHPVSFRRFTVPCSQCADGPGKVVKVLCLACLTTCKGMLYT